MVPPECRRSNWIAVGESACHNPAGKYRDRAMSYSPTGRVLVRKRDAEAGRRRGVDVIVHIITPIPLFQAHF